MKRGGGFEGHHGSCSSGRKIAAEMVGLLYSTSHYAVFDYLHAGYVLCSFHESRHSMHLAPLERRYDTAPRCCSLLAAD